MLFVRNLLIIRFLLKCDKFCIESLVMLMFWERFESLCKKKGEFPNTVGKNIGVSSGICTKWKSGVIPKGEILLKIADYLDCSVDFLLGRTDNPAAHKQTAHTIFSNNSDVRGGIGNNSRISIGGSASGEYADEQLRELINLYSGLSTRKKAELLILVDDFAKECKE